MKKAKVPSLKELESKIKDWKTDPDRLALVTGRNAKSKEAKDGKINMRVNGDDLIALTKLAEKKGIGYQTLLGMIIHQYVDGTLVDVEEIKKILKVG